METRSVSKWLLRSFSRARSASSRSANVAAVSRMSCCSSVRSKSMLVTLSPGMGDAFTVVFGGTLVFFILLVLVLGLFSKRSALDILDWKPTRSPEVEAQNDIDDVAQMIAAQNELRRKRGLPERDEEEIEASVRRHRAELAEERRRYREEHDE